MPTATTTPPDPTDPLSVDATAWLRPQTEAALSLYGRSMTLAEQRMRRQADLLRDLAAATNPAQALSIQTRFLQDFWAAAIDDTMKAFAAYRATHERGARRS